jgi:hypothetical protein
MLKRSSLRSGRRIIPSSSPECRSAERRQVSPLRLRDSSAPALRVTAPSASLRSRLHNTRPLKQRGNRTPLELAGVDLGDKDLVRLIEHKMRYSQAAAAQKA